MYWLLSPRGSISPNILNTSCFPKFSQTSNSILIHLNKTKSDRVICKEISVNTFHKAESNPISMNLVKLFLRGLSKTLSKTHIISYLAFL